MFPPGGLNIFRNISEDSSGHLEGPWHVTPVSTKEFSGALYKPLHIGSSTYVVSGLL